MASDHGITVGCHLDDVHAPHGIFHTLHTWSTRRPEDAGDPRRVSQHVEPGHPSAYKANDDGTCVNSHTQGCGLASVGHGDCLGTTQHGLWEIKSGETIDKTFAVCAG